MEELINVKEIAFHLVNLIILVVAARLLLYKPVSKFMSERSERFEREHEQIEEEKKRLAELEEQRDALMRDAEQRAEEYARVRREKIDGECAHLIEKAELEAKKRADEIINAAKAKSRAELEQNRQKMVDSSVKMAEFILSRKITELDEDKLVDSFISGFDE